MELDIYIYIYRRVMLNYALEGDYTPIKAEFSSFIATVGETEEEK